MAATDGSSASRPEMMSTPEHVRSESWWPTKPATSREAYAGAARCAECHGAIAAEQATSQMAHTLVRAGSSSVAREHPRLEYTTGPFRYLLQRSGKDLVMTVRDGEAERTAVMEWAFGSGDVGQSYAWHDAQGTLLESRFNYFSTVHGLAETPGRLAGPPLSLGMAEGRPLEPFEARTCFACHTTALFPGEVTRPENIVAGVSCEACHGPGAEHVRLMEARRGTGGNGAARTEAAIVNSARLSPTRAVEMCGACHGTPWDVRLAGAAGVQTVRFPAYRLEKSKCWGQSGDERLKCAACHDPHGPQERNLAAYDSACLACHVTRATGRTTGDVDHRDAVHDGLDHRDPDQRDPDHPGKACPVATSNCASCHMPKYELPEMHSRFTDHQIRVARKGEEFPE